MATKNAEKETQKEPQQEPKPCMKCGWDPENAQVEVSEGEKEEYLRAILGSRSYNKNYDLFEGKLKVVMTSLNTVQSEELQNLINQLDKSDPQIFVTEAAKVKLIYYLKSVSSCEEAFTPPEKLEKHEDAKKAFNERFGELSEDLLSILIRVLIEFSKLLGQLAEAAFDKNFWKGAGLV